MLIAHVMSTMTPRTREREYLARRHTIYRRKYPLCFSVRLLSYSFRFLGSPNISRSSALENDLDVLSPNAEVHTSDSFGPQEQVVWIVLMLLQNDAIKPWELSKGGLVLATEGKLRLGHCRHSGLSKIRDINADDRHPTPR